MILLITIWRVAVLLDGFCKGFDGPDFLLGKQNAHIIERDGFLSFEIMDICKCTKHSNQCTILAVSAGNASYVKVL